MRFGTYKFVAGTALTSVLLAGCNGFASPSSASSSFASLPVARAQKSWVRPDAVKGDLVYVDSPYDDAIFLFTYPGLNLVGLIANPSKWTLTLGGLCSDTKGNVFVPLLSQNEILEFAHGKTEPIATIASPDGEPYSCGYDPKSGSLAVAEYLISGVVGVAVYSHESGTPTIYQDGYVQEAAWPTYDASGNLFVGGGDDAFELSELPRGAKAFKNLTIDSKDRLDAANIQWDGKYVTLFSELSAGGAAIFRFKISGSTATVVGSTPIKDVGGDWTWISGKTVVVGNQARNALQIFRYPGGGNFTKSTDVYQASAVTISAGTQR